MLRMGLEGSCGKEGSGPAVLWGEQVTILVKEEGVLPFKVQCVTS